MFIFMIWYLDQIFYRWFIDNNFAVFHCIIPSIAEAFGSNLLFFIVISSAYHFIFQCLSIWSQNFICLSYFIMFGN